MAILKASEEFIDFDIGLSNTHTGMCVWYYGFRLFLGIKIINQSNEMVGQKKEDCKGVCVSARELVLVWFL